MKKSTLEFSITLFILLLMTPIIVFGQSAEAICSEFVNQAYSDLGNNCAGAQANEICYGFGTVSASFYVDGESLMPEGFSEEGSTRSIIDVDNHSTLENVSGSQSLTLEQSSSADEWGIAFINVQAGLPSQISANGASFVLFGNIILENGVLPEDAFVLGNHVEVSISDTPIFNKPPAYNSDGYPSEIIATEGGIFVADAISSDGAWVRIFYRYEHIFAERSTAWLQVSDLSPELDLSILPELGPNDFAPLQKFYLDGNTPSLGCPFTETNGLLIQSPEEIELDFIINDLPLRISATVFFDILDSGALRMSVLGGVVQINPGLPNEIIVAAGETTLICLAEEFTDSGIDGLIDNRVYDASCGVQQPYLIANTARFKPLEDVPTNLIDHSVPIVSLARPSGVGRPRPRVSIMPEYEAERIRVLCNGSEFDGEICGSLQ